MLHSLSLTRFTLLVVIVAQCATLTLGTPFSARGGLKHKDSWTQTPKEMDDGSEKGSTERMEIRKRSSSSVPPGYHLRWAYISPTIESVEDILAHKTTMTALIETWHTQWKTACLATLGQSASFKAGQTFGWYHFKRNYKKEAQVAEAVVTTNVGCYETDAYDPLGNAPGKPVNVYTMDVAHELHWIKGKALRDAEVLKKKLADIDAKAGKGGSGSTQAIVAEKLA